MTITPQAQSSVIQAARCLGKVNSAILQPYIPSERQVELTNDVPSESRDLIWSTFFESRNRGVSLEVHFPWIDDSCVIFCLTIFDQALAQKKMAVASLVLKVIKSETGDLFGLIGLVCVAPQFRRQGLSNKLVAAAIEVGKDRNWSALILWTHKPWIYSGHGFIVSGRELYGSVDAQPIVSDTTTTLIYSTKWPTPADKGIRRGLPPFATSAIEYSRDSNRVVVLQTPTGPTVAEWDGSPGVVLKIIQCVIPGKWFLNAAPDDALLELLVSQGINFELITTTNRMTKSLSTQISRSWPKIGILDRI